MVQQVVSWFTGGCRGRGSAGSGARAGRRGGWDVLAAIGGGLANLPTCRLSGLLGSRKVGDLERWRVGGRVGRRGGVAVGRLGRVRWSPVLLLLVVGGMSWNDTAAAGGYRGRGGGARAG